MDNVRLCRGADVMKDKNLFHTVLCDLLNIKYPIIQGAMTRVGGHRLVAAVSNAGGLGVLPTFGVSPEKLRRSIVETRALTDKPFAVNIVPIGRAFAESRAKIVIDEGIEIATTGRGDPTTPIVSMLKRHNIKVLPVVPTVRHAIRAVEEGADAVVASGCEAGGHVGTIASLPLIPLMIDAVKVPVVAAGGIGDSRGFVAALALGACGIQMGTRFYATHEADVSPSEKCSILEASEEDTVVVTMLSGKPIRVLLDQEIDKWLQLRKQGATDKELAALATEIRKLARDDPEKQPVIAGQISGMIRTIESAEDIINQTIEGAAAICHKLHLLAIAQ